MWPISFRRIALAGFATVVLFVAPAAKAGSVTIDLGAVAYGIQVNSSVVNLAFPSDHETYTYSQLLFNPAVDLSIVVDGGSTLEEVLASLIGLPNGGIINYSFPFINGASGSYSQNGDSEPFGTGFPGVESFTATSQSGQSCSGSNSVGSTIHVDPRLSGTTYDTILGCEALMVTVPGSPTPSTTTVTLTLGTVTVGNNVTTYEGEATDTTWTNQSSVAPATTGVPEPSAVGLETAGIAALCALRVRRRFRKARE